MPFDAAANAAFPNGSWPGTMKTTSSAMRPSTVSTSPLLLAAIQVSTSSRIARSSSVIGIIFQSSSFRLRQHRAKERTLMAGETAGLLGEGQRLVHIGIRRGAFAMALVVGEAWEAEQAQRNIALAFRRQEIAVVHAAKARNQVDPHLRVLFEFRCLIGVDDVADMACDHSSAPSLIPPSPSGSARA